MFDPVARGAHQKAGSVSTVHDRLLVGAKSSETRSGAKIPWWFGAFPFAIAFDNRLLSIHKAVLLQILAYAGDKGWCDPANRTLAKYITASLNSKKDTSKGASERASHKSVSDKTIQDALDRLEELGYIRREEVPWTEKNQTCRVIYVTFSEEAMLTRFPKGVPVPKVFREKAARYGGLKYEGCELKVVGGANSSSGVGGNSDSQVGGNSSSYKEDAHTGEAHIGDEVKRPTQLHSGSSHDARHKAEEGSSPSARSSGVLASLSRRSRLDPAAGCWPLVDGCSEDQVDRVFKALSGLVKQWTDGSKLDMGNVIGEAVAALGEEHGVGVVLYAVDVLRHREKRGRSKPDIALVYLAGIVTTKLIEGGLKASERAWKNPKGSAKTKAVATPPEDRSPPASDHPETIDARRINPDLDADGTEPFQSPPAQSAIPSGHLTADLKARWGLGAKRTQQSGEPEHLDYCGCWLAERLGGDSATIATTLAVSWERGPKEVPDHLKPIARALTMAGVCLHRVEGFSVRQPDESEDDDIPF